MASHKNSRFRFLLYGVLLLALFNPVLVSAQDQLNISIEGYTLPEWPNHLFYAVCNGSDMIIDAWSLSDINNDVQATNWPDGWKPWQLENEVAWTADDPAKGVQPGECKSWFTHWGPAQFASVNWVAISTFGNGGASWGKARGHSK